MNVNHYVGLSNNNMLINLQDKVTVQDQCNEPVTYHDL